MRTAEVQLSAKNKTQTQTLQKAFAWGTPYGKVSQSLKEITVAIAFLNIYILHGLNTKKHFPSEVSS